MRGHGLMSSAGAWGGSRAAGDGQDRLTQSPVRSLTLKLIDLLGEQYASP